MIEPTPEMVQLIYEQIDFVNHGDDGIREGLAAVLAIVARDRCMERRGHVYHPLARKWPAGRGGSHPHYCVSCSDGEVQGPGCGSCRMTGMDQTPWPTCEECAR